MLKFSIAVLFAMTMATLTIAASAMPVPPEVGVRSIEVAQLS